MKIKIFVEPTKTGYSAYAEKYAIYTTGKDLLSLNKNIVEAVKLYFEHSRISFLPSDLDIVLLND